MGFIDNFADWQTKTGTFYQRVETKDSNGRPETTWTVITGGTDITFNYWITTANETNRNDKFEGQEVGVFLVKKDVLVFTPNTTMKITVSTTDYFITGVDNVAGFNDFYTINWRKSVG